MEHFYQNIHGWFTFRELYENMVKKFDNAKFVEVGVWKGQSAAFLAVEIKNSGKNIELFCIDPWSGETLDHNPEAYNCAEKTNNSLYEHFLQNIEPVKDVITPIKDYSVPASSRFEDFSLDFVFIDASHDYESVKTDLNAWYPKIKRGGVFAGHDYQQNSVKKAVDDFFAKKSLNVIYLQSQYSWVVDIL